MKPKKQYKLLRKFGGLMLLLCVFCAGFLCGCNDYYRNPADDPANTTQTTTTP